MHDRLTPGASAPLPHRPAMPVVLVFFAAAALVFWLLHQGHVRDLWLEDFPVYARAVHSWLTGHDPYDASLAPLFFLYPPVFLYISSFLSHLAPANSGAATYAVVLTLAACAIPLLLARYFFRMVWLGPLFALLIFFASSRFTGVLALCSMNIASILYCLAFAAAVPGLRKDKWMWFYLAVFLAAIIKITFLALLLLPLLAGRRQWLRSIGCCAAVAAMNLLERILVPSLYEGYEWSLKQGILAEQQFGYGVFGIVATYHHKLHSGAGVGAYIVGGVFALTVLTLMFLLRRRLEPGGELANNGVWMALVVTTIILVNPREMQYDLDIALFSGFVLWVYGLRTQRLLVLLILLFLPSLVVPLVVLNPHLHGIYETMLVLAAFALAFWRMWREAGSEQAKMKRGAARPVAEIPVTDLSQLRKASGA